MQFSRIARMTFRVLWFDSIDMTGMPFRHMNVVLEQQNYKKICGCIGSLGENERFLLLYSVHVEAGSSYVNTDLLFRICL